jgi:hypothetical protein
MSDEATSVNDQVARQVYPAAVSQARAEVIIQLAVIAAFVAFWAVFSFKRELAWTVGVITSGAVATAYDIRWWLWLRRADPVEAYARVQARDDRIVSSLRFVLTLLVSFGLFVVWWRVTK